MRWRYGLVFALLGCVLTLFLLLAFHNPDMTRTRLLIEFWPYYLIGAAALFVITYITSRWR